MRVLDVRALPEWSEEQVRVNKWGTIRVERNNYSVPTQLRDQWVQAKIYEDRIEVFYRGVKQLSAERRMERIENVACRAFSKVVFGQGEQGTPYGAPCSPHSLATTGQ